jgi:PAS domain-containing protein
MSKLAQVPSWAETLIESISEGVVTLDASGCILSFNRSAERITRSRSRRPVH